MKKILTMASLLALIAIPSWAGGVGVMFSAWDTSEAGDDNGGGVKIEFEVVSAIDFEIRAAWLGELDFVSQGQDFRLEAVPVDVGLSYEFLKDQKVQPFLGGGFSFAFLNGIVGSDAAVRVDDEAGYYVVGGVESGFAERFTGFAEILYRGMKSEVRSDGFLNRDLEDVGVDLAGATFNIGVMLSW